jgi:phage shock protein A
MPTDAGLHAQMTYLIQEEKRYEEQLAELTEELELWKKRVQLAEDKGMPDLADEARQRARTLMADFKEAEVKLETLQHEKKMLRKEARRPTGEEVARAEAMLERLRQSGIVDPDEAALEREFDDLAAEQAVRELRRTGEDEVDVDALRELKRKAEADEADSM